MLYIRDFRKVGNSRPCISQRIREIEYMKRYLHKLSRDARVCYVISNIQSEREVHAEHRFDDCSKQVKLLDARSQKSVTVARGKLRVKGRHVFSSSW